MGIETAAIAGLALIGGGQQAYSSKRNREVQHDSKRSNQRAMDEAEKVRRAREAQALQQRSAFASREAQRRKQSMAGGIGATNRTSPVGIPGGGTSYGKQTLIGGGP